MFIWNHRFVDLSAAGTLPFVQDEMGDLHFNLGQFNDLVRIIRIRVIKMGVSTYAQFRNDIFHFGGLKHLLTKALPSLLLFRLTLFLRLFLKIPTLFIQFPDRIR